MVGRQRLSKVRLRVTLAIYPALLVLLCFAARTHPGRLWWLAGGLGFGSLLGLFGLNKTRFEPTQKVYFTRHMRIWASHSRCCSSRVSSIVFSRSMPIEPTAPHGMGDFARSPLTLAVFGLLAGYYITYAIGLFRWRLSYLRAKRQRESLKERGRDDA